MPTKKKDKLPPYLNPSKTQSITNSYMERHGANTTQKLSTQQQAEKLWNSLLKPAGKKALDAASYVYNKLSTPSESKSRPGGTYVRSAPTKKESARPGGTYERKKTQPTTQKATTDKLPFELTPEGKRMVNNPRRKEAAIKEVTKQNGGLTNGTGTTSQRPGGTYQRQKSTNNNSSSMSWSDFANASKNVERKRKEDAAAKERAAARRNHQEETGIDAAARKRSNLKAEMKDVGKYIRQRDQMTIQAGKGNAKHRDEATKKRQAFDEAFAKSHPNVDLSKLNVKGRKPTTTEKKKSMTRIG